MYTAGYLDEEDLEEVTRQGVVGDIATMFYCQNGRDHRVSLNTRSSGPELNFIRTHPASVCVVADPGKAEALRAALEGGLMRTLIVDETTARLALELP